jgi:hypothetical protein
LEPFPNNDFAYARDSLRILEQNLNLYRQGSRECYRVIAIQLRLLLCDTNRVHGRRMDIALIPRLIPDLQLGSLDLTDRPGPSEDPRVIPINEVVKLPLQAWLAQEITVLEGKRISVRDFIRLVCEQDGGAHVDPRPLTSLRGWNGRDVQMALLGETLLGAARPIFLGSEHRAA